MVMIGHLEWVVNTLEGIVEEKRLLFVVLLYDLAGAVYVEMGRILAICAVIWSHVVSEVITSVPIVLIVSPV